MPLPDYFSFEITTVDETDLVLVSLHDSRTNFTVRTALPNSGKQTASIMAFAGARYSRASISAVELFKEIKAAKKDANSRLSTIFKAYGHASVADMANMFCYIENVPDIYSPMFYGESSVGAGQGRSTRYQDFSSSTPTDLQDYFSDDEVKKLVSHSPDEMNQINTSFQHLQNELLEKYRKWVSILTEKYTKIYEIDTQNKQQMGALAARVFDTARYFLPAGTALKTSFAYLTSAREWARLISFLTARDDRDLRYLGSQLEFLFAPDPDVAESVGYTPEAPDLIRYTSADETSNNNLQSLKEYLVQTGFDSLEKPSTQFGFKPLSIELYAVDLSAGEKILAQNILQLYPTINTKWLAQYVRDISVQDKLEISEILFSDHTHHNQTGNAFRVNTHSFVLTCSISETRDLIRHRAWGRFVPMMACEQNYRDIINEGYTLPLYLTNNSHLSAEREQFEQDILEYYNHLKQFADSVKSLDWFPQHLLIQLLPFCHVMKLWFHGSPKEMSYLTNLRVRPGGHINYRYLAYQMAKLASQSDPLLSSLDLGELKEPDACSRGEFVDRS